MNQESSLRPRIDFISFTIRNFSFGVESYLLIKGILEPQEYCSQSKNILLYLTSHYFLCYRLVRSFEKLEKYLIFKESTKMEPADMSVNSNEEKSTLNLPAPPDQAELYQCLPCGSQILSSFDQTLCLPYVRKDHDLIDILSVCVIKDASNHPRKPPNEMMSTILNTTKLTNMVMSEMKRYGLAIKSFSSALGMNPATFSLALREPRHWFDTNLVQVMSFNN